MLWLLSFLFFFFFFFFFFFLEGSLTCYFFLLACTSCPLFLFYFLSHLSLYLFSQVMDMAVYIRFFPPQSACSHSALIASRTPHLPIKPPPPNWLYPPHSHSALLTPLGSKSSGSTPILSHVHSDILDATYLSLPSLIPSSTAQPRIQHSSNPSLLSSRKYTRS